MSSTIQTAAASQAAPPRKRYNGVALIGVGVGVLVVALFLNFILNLYSPNGSPPLAPITAVGVGIVGVAVGIVFLLIGAVLAPLDARYNSQVFPAALREWDRTWVCQSCGTWFLV